MTESVDERHEKLLARRRELAKRPEAKAKKAAYMRELRERGDYKRPDVLAERRAHYSEYSKRPEVKEHMVAYRREHYQRPEVKARVSAYQKERYKRPEIKAKYLELRKRYRMRPEKKAHHYEYNRQWQERNPGLKKRSMDRFRQKRTEWLTDLRAKSSCSICGQSFPDHPSVIDFHHKSGESKESGISRMRLQTMSQIKAEVDKCIAVCANCHRIIHQKQRIRKERTPSNEIARDRQRWYSKMKAAQICSVCGKSFPDYPSVMEFHHKGDSKKEGGISSMAIRTAVPLSQVQAEIAKCIVVCANCHRIVHDLDRQMKKRHSDKVN